MDPGSRWRNSGSRVLGGTLDGSRPPVPPCDAVAQVVLLSVEQYKLGGGVHGHLRGNNQEGISCLLPFLGPTAATAFSLVHYIFFTGVRWFCISDSLLG